MDLGIANRTAIVAGGSRGCGRGIVEALAAEGARVLFTGRNGQAVTATETDVRAAGGQVTGMVADMTTIEDATAIPMAAREIYGDADILIVNAPNAFPKRSGHLRGFENCEDEDYVETFENHVLSVVRLTRAVLPAMKTRGWGRLLNIGTIAFKTPHQEDPMPATDVRIAVAPLQRILAHEYGRWGITANIIATGPFESELSRDYRASLPEVKTPEWYAQMLPVARWGQPIEMGWLAAFLCSDRAAFLTGEVIRLDGGYTKSLF
jgi:3-oxoacyl-[acyl-carrier protein] reductase